VNLALSALSAAGWRKSRRRLLTYAAAAVGTAAALAGCGTSSAGNSAGGGSDIVIGLNVTESGPTAAYFNGAEGNFMAWIDYVNDNGGLEGHKVKVIALDDKGDDAQGLLNFQTLWTQDHAVMIATVSLNSLPYQLVKRDNIPVIAYEGDDRMYASYYPTVLPMGDNIAEVAAESAYYYTQILHKHPKTVAIQLTSAYSAWQNILVKNWKQFGATNVIVVPDGNVTADCSATILKLKSENVDYFDLEGQQAAQCVLAEEKLKWTPSMGQGGAGISDYGLASEIGQPMNGLVAGSPNTLYDGEPIYPSPTTATKLYAANAKKYNPKFSDVGHLNDQTGIIAYALAKLATQLAGGVLNEKKDVTSANIVTYGQGLKNWTSGLQPPVASFAPHCKSGSDGTMWGYWEYNSSTESKIELVPQSGTKWITSLYVGQTSCTLTERANMSFPNG
jgi:Periplasmic binding protein